MPRTNAISMTGDHDKRPTTGGHPQSLLAPTTMNHTVAIPGRLACVDDVLRSTEIAMFHLLRPSPQQRVVDAVVILVAQGYVVPDDVQIEAASRLGSRPW